MFTELVNMLGNGARSAETVLSHVTNQLRDFEETRRLRGEFLYFDIPKKVSEVYGMSSNPLKRVFPFYRRLELAMIDGPLAPQMPREAFRGHLRVGGCAEIRSPSVDIQPKQRCRLRTCRVLTSSSSPCRPCGR